MRALSNDPERIAKQSRAMTLRWSDPEERARYGAIIKELWTDPDYRAAVVSAGRKRYENPEFRAMQSIGAVNRIARNKNFRSKIEEKVETLFTELGLVRNVDFFTSKRFHSKDPDYVDGCFGMNVDLWFPALNLVVEMNGTFHHSDPRFYPDRSKLCETQRIGLARYERKLRWLASQNIRIMELWSNEDSLAEELLVWPIVAEILCIDEDFDALEGVLRKTISTNNSKRGPA